MRNKILTAMLFLLIPMQSFAKEAIKKFRWDAKGRSAPQMSFKADMGDGESSSTEPKISAEHSKLYLKATGELILKETQVLGDARVHGTWRQSVIGTDGNLVYSAGEVYSSIPNLFLPLGVEKGSQSKLNIEEIGKKIPELKDASKIFPASLEVRQSESNTWESYWRVNYLSAKEDQMKYLLLNSAGTVLSKGNLDWDGVDGRAMVFPKGAKFSELQEAPLRQLLGDGTLKGLNLWVHSVLNLSVWQPDLIYFFPQEDRRFDLTQVYYSIEQSYSWLKEHLGVEMQHPVEVRLHVGENGVSNAAFYHQNTIYLGTGDGQVYKDMLRDPSVVTHESIHAVIDAFVGLPSEGEGGGYNEGFSDLFTALILENPKMGEASYLKAPFRRSLENKLIAYKDFSPGVYQNGTILGATFWDMKSYLGTDQTAKLAFRTMVRLGAGAKFDDFGPALKSAAESFLDAATTVKVIQSAKARGWKTDL